LSLVSAGQPPRPAPPRPRPQGQKVPGRRWADRSLFGTAHSALHLVPLAHCGDAPWEATVDVGRLVRTPPPGEVTTMQRIRIRIRPGKPRGHAQKDGLTGELAIVQARPETGQSRRRATTLRRCRLTVTPQQGLIEGMRLGSVTVNSTWPGKDSSAGTADRISSFGSSSASETTPTTRPSPSRIGAAPAFRRCVSSTIFSYGASRPMATAVWVMTLPAVYGDVAMGCSSGVAPGWWHDGLLTRIRRCRAGRRDRADGSGGLQPVGENLPGNGRRPSLCPGVPDAGPEQPGPADAFTRPETLCRYPGAAGDADVRRDGA
jgi:hypothetical protein